MSDAPTLTRAQWLTAIALIVGGLAPIFDSTIVNVALKSLAADLGVQIATIQWVSTAYLLSLAISIPVVAWAELRFGSRRVWIAALLVFLVGSVACSFAWDAGSLIAFRVVQGFGAGLMMPLMQSVLMRQAGGRNIGTLMGIVSLPIALGPILGPVIGGGILAVASWRWLFLVNVPLCLVGVVLALRWVPGGTVGSRRPFDWLGFLLVSPGLAAVLLGLSNSHDDGGFARSDVVWPLAVGALLLAAFTWHALRRGDTALVRLGLLRARELKVATVAMVFTGAALFGAVFLLPLFWQTVRGTDALGAGLMMIPQGIGTLVVRTQAGRLTDRIGPRWIAVTGFALAALATIQFAFADASTSPVWLGVVLFLRGCGLGTVFIPIMAAAYTGLPGGDVADASIITRIAQQLGGALGTALLAVLLQASLNGGGTAVEAFHVAFWWATGFAAVSMLVALLLPVISREARG